MCPSEREMFDSMLGGAVEMDELNSAVQRKWYQRAVRAIVAIALLIPRLIFRRSR